MHKLKINKKKEFKVEIAYTVKVKSINIPNPYLLPLFGSFNFDLSFSILLNIISNNTPVLFFIKYFKFSSSFYIVSLYPSY